MRQYFPKSLGFTRFFNPKTHFRKNGWKNRLDTGEKSVNNELIYLSMTQWHFPRHLESLIFPWIFPADGTHVIKKQISVFFIKKWKICQSLVNEQSLSFPEYEEDLSHSWKFSAISLIWLSWNETPAAGKVRIHWLRVSDVPSRDVQASKRTLACLNAIYFNLSLNALLKYP